MRPLLSIKTLFRTPFKTLLTFLLLAAVTFALFSRVAEYVILNRELDKAANSYKGFGAAEIAPATESYPDISYPFYIYADSRYIKNYPKEDQKYLLNNLRYQPLTPEQVQAISKLPYIEKTDVRYMTAGVSDQYFRLEEGSGWGKYSNSFVIEGTVSDIIYNRSYNSDDIASIRLILNDYKLLAGAPSRISSGQISINAKIFTDKQVNYNAEKGPGGMLGYILSLSPIETTQDNTDYLEKLKIGNRYIFVVNGDAAANSVYSFSGFQRIEGSTEETLNTKECTDLREYIDMVDADLHTLDVVYTKDMSAIMRFAQNKMMIQSGRALTEADHVSGSNVCVISTDFAKANNLAVGDKMTLKLGTELFEQYKGLGAVAYVSGRYSPAVKTVELEIVGIYIDTDGINGQLNEPHWSYSVNTVFVPKSLLPMDESTLTDHMYSPAEFSFTVSARDIIDFEKTAPAEFEKLGLKLIFDNDGWPGVVEAFETSKQLSLIAIAGLSVALVAATGFIVFLFIVRKKREYAIMRALGTPPKASARALILPLMVLSTAAVIAGSGAAWGYTVLTVARNDALSIIKNYSVDASLPPWVMIGCIAAELLLVLIFADFGLRGAASIPPLRLLQDNRTGRKKIRKTPKTKYITIQPRIPDVNAIPVINELPKPLKKKKKHMPQMNPLLSIETLLRTPFKTLLTFLLLTAVTFALFSRVAEYAILNREIENAANSYQGVGSAEVAPAVDSSPNSPSYIDADPRIYKDLPQELQDLYRNQFRYQPLTSDKIKTISKLLDIENTNVRYMTAGVSDQYYRLKEGSDWYPFANKFVIEGTILNIEYNSLIVVNGLSFYSDEIMKNKIILDDYKILAGDLSFFSGKQISIDAYSMISKEGNGRVTSNTYNIYSYSKSSQYDTEYLKGLTIGDRYIIVGYFSEIPDDPEFYLGDYLKELSCQIIQHVEGSTEETLATEECADLREYIDMVNADIHTLDVVYTDDMSTIMRFAKNNMMIQSGRMLTKADNVNGSNICVISNDFAKANNLEVGDKLALKLGTELFEQYKGLGAVASSLNRYSPAVNEVELEIVGIYIDTDGANGQLKEPHWSYSINTVFVPKSLLPMDESTLTDHVFSPAEFSFTVNAQDILEFEKTAPAEFEKLGLKLIFDNDGWPGVVEAFETSKQLSLIAIAGLSVALVAATGFIVFLFVMRKKREYAIMRALGTPQKAAAKALILPLMVLSIAAVLAGSGAAWVYTLLTVARNNALTIIEDYTVDASLPPWVMIGCIVGELLLVLIFAVIGLKRAASIPPLRLLQDNRTGRKKIRKTPKTRDIGAQAQAVAFTAIPAVDVLPKPVKKNNGHVLRYITRHIRRSIGKSLLSLLLPALLLGAFGQFALSQNAQVEIGNNTVVEAKLVGGLQLTYVEKFRKNNSVENIYYEYEDTVGFNESSGTLIITNDIARFTIKQPEITFMEGYDITCMDNLNPVCIVGSEFLNKFGLRLGDQIHITSESALSDIKVRFIDHYRIKNPNDTRTDDEIIKANQAVIKASFSAQGLNYTIVGKVTSSLGEKYDEAVFSPGTKDSQKIYGSEIPKGFLAFTLTEPLNAHEFGRTVEKMFQINQGEIGGGNLAFVMDTGKIDNILNTIALMKKLYPAVVAAGVLIGSFICGLIVIQSSKEAAILRVLGTTRKRTGAMLALEQLFLCLVGLLIGVGGLLIYKGEALVEIAGKLGFFAGLYFAACLACSFACSAIATRRNVLELLQTKE